MKQGGKSVRGQAVQGDIRSKCRICPVLISTPNCSITAISFVKLGFGQPVFRDAHGHHSAFDRQFFKHGDVVPFLGQEPGCGKAGGAGADNSDFLILCFP